MQWGGVASPFYVIGVLVSRTTVSYVLKKRCLIDDRNVEARLGNHVECRTFISRDPENGLSADCLVPIPEKCLAKRDSCCGCEA